MTSLFIVFKDSRYLSWLTWMILSNNVLQKKTFVVVTLIEHTFTLYYTLILLARSGHQEGTRTYTNDNDSPLNSVNLEVLINFSKYLDEVTSEITTVFVVIIALQLAFYLAVMLTLLYQSSRAATLQVKELDLPRRNLKIFCSIIVVFSNMIYIPMMEIHMRGFIVKYQQKDGNTQYMVFQSLNVIGAICHLLLVVYGKKLFMLNTPNELIPWSAPDSSIILLNYSSKIITVASGVIDQKARFLIYEILAILAVRMFGKTKKMTMFNKFDYHIDLTNKTYHSVLNIGLFIGLVNFGFHDSRDKGLVFFLVLIPVVMYATLQWELIRRSQILDRAKTNEIQSVVEVEFLFIVMMQHLSRLNDDKILLSDENSKIIALIENHQTSCFDFDCICQHYETYCQMIKESARQKQNLFMISDPQQIALKNLLDGIIIDDYIGPLNCTRVEVKRLKKIENSYGLKSQYQAPSDGNVKANASVQSYKLNADEQQQPEESLIAKEVRVDANLIRVQFMSCFIFSYFKHYYQEHSKSVQTLLLISYYATHYLRKSMCSVNMMRGYDTKNLSFTENQIHLVNEFYLIKILNKRCEVEYKISKEDNFDEEYFIRISNLNDQFKECINHLSDVTVDFWNGFTKDDLDLVNQSNTSREIAKQLVKAQSIFTELDNIKKTKSSQLYYQYALMQLNILNNEAEYRLYIQKAKQVKYMNINSIKIIFQNSINDDYGFLIVEAKSSRFGKILYSNLNFVKLLKTKLKDLANGSIYQLMPELIKKSHYKFEELFNKTGNSPFLNKKSTILVKNAQGYVAPMEQVIKFSYSQKFGYAFLAINNLVSEMVPFKNELVYKTNQLIFIIFDMKFGEIHEISQSFAQYIKKQNIKYLIDSLLNEKNLNIKNLFLNFNFKKYKADSARRSINQETYEKEHFIRTHSKDQDQDYQNRGIQQQLKAKVTILEESYGSGILKLAFIVMSIIEEDQEEDFESSTFSNLNLDKQMTLKQKHNTNNNSSDAEEDNSSSFGMGDQSDQQAELNAFKQLQAKSLETKPKQLKLVTQFITLMLLIVLSVSSIGLGYVVINISNYNKSLEFYGKAQLVTFDLIQSSLAIRNMINIANNYEADVSSIATASRIQYYNRTLQNFVNEIKMTQNAIFNSDFKGLSVIQKFPSQPKIQLEYLDNRNKVYLDQSSPNSAYSLYIQRMQDFINTNSLNLKGKTKYATLNMTTNSSYQPNQAEQLIYFLSQNGNQAIRIMDESFLLMISDEISMDLQNIQRAILILYALSIFAVVIVGIVIAPIISRAEQNKYLSLQFFLKLQNEDIKFFIDRITSCQILENTDMQKMIVDMQLQDQNVDDNNSEALLGSFFKEPEDFDLEDDSYIKDNQRILKHFGSTRGLFYSKKPNNFTVTQEIKVNSNNSNISQSYMNQPIDLGQSQAQQDSSRSMKVALNDDQVDQDNTQKSKFKSFKKIPSRVLDILKSNQEKEKESVNFSESNEEERSRSNFNRFSIDQKSESQIIQDQSLISIDKSMNGSLIDQEQKFDASLYQTNIEGKKEKIKRKAVSVKNGSMLLMICVLLVFGCYFGIQYLITSATLRYCKSSVQQLNVIFKKSLSPTTLFLWYKLEIITNNTLPLVNIGEDGSKQNYFDYNMDLKDKYELQYAKLRQDMPVYLKDAQQGIEKMESDQLCNNIFDNDPTNMALCRSLLNGIFLNGLTNAQFYMYQVILTSHINQDQMFVNKKWDRTAVIQTLNDKTMIDIVDSIYFVIQPVFLDIQKSCIESIKSFIIKMDNYHVGVYVCFVCICLIVMLLYVKIGYTWIKNSIWNTNILLKMIPLSALENQEVELIKKFVNA